jgi:hypothetical protein
MKDTGQSRAITAAGSAGCLMIVLKINGLTDFYPQIPACINHRQSWNARSPSLTLVTRLNIFSHIHYFNSNVFKHVQFIRIARQACRCYHWLNNPGTPLGLPKTVSTDGVSENGGSNRLTGFSVIEADNMDAALEIAKACPFLEMGTIDVAEVFEM